MYVRRASICSRADLSGKTMLQNCAGATKGDFYMSVKIRISYQTQEELEKVVEKLKPLGITLKISKKADTHFKYAYVLLEKNKEK